MITPIVNWLWARALTLVHQEGSEWLERPKEVEIEVAQQEPLKISSRDEKSYNLAQFYYVPAFLLNLNVVCKKQCSDFTFGNICPRFSWNSRGFWKVFILSKVKHSSFCREISRAPGCSEGHQAMWRGWPAWGWTICPTAPSWRICSPCLSDLETLETSTCPRSRMLMSLTMLVNQIESFGYYIFIHTASALKLPSHISRRSATLADLAASLSCGSSTSMMLR